MGKIEMKSALKILPLAMGLAFVAQDAQALGLGALEVKSQLNQPLVAEIPLIGVGPGELDELSVRLASPEAFDRVGLPRPAGVTANLQFSVGRNARGEPVVRVTTSNRVDDPFVAFLLEADWGRGSVVREFTALVDPPHIAAATVTPMTAPTVAAAPVVAPPAPASTPEPISEATPAVAEATPPEPAATEPLPPEPTAPAPEPTPEPTPIAAASPPPPDPAPLPQPAPQPEPQVIAEAPPPPTPEPAPAPVPVAPPIPSATPGSHEVVSGDTLWEIAASQPQGASMAQMMLAIQRANPDAFLRDNINLLRKGAVLRIPSADEARDLASIEAEAQVREQMAAWRALAPTPAPVPSPGDAPAIALPPAATAQTPARPAATPGAGTSGARLEIAPPAGAGAAGAQSGASSGGSGSELRAELEQAREDLSARDAELRELRSRLTEQESLASEQERLIQLKDSQLSAMEEALRQRRTEAASDPSAAAEPVAAVTPDGTPVDGTASVDATVGDPATTVVEPAAATTPPPAEPAATPAPEAAPVAAAEPWFRDPLVLGGAGVLLVGGLLALLLRRRRAAPKSPLPSVPVAAPSRARLSDDADFLSNLPAPAVDDGADRNDRNDVDERATRAAEAAVAASAPVAAAAPTPAPANPLVGELQRNVDAAPADLDAHVSLLRQLYNAGDADGFLAAAERMRARVDKPADPRWREVVVMGMGLVPGHALFRELQWNPVSSVDVRTRPLGAEAAAPAPPPTPEGFDERETAERPAFDAPPPDAAGMDDTRLELAKAYIEIGDTDGARGMLEEVLAEGSPAARAEAERLLKQIG